MSVFSFVLKRDSFLAGALIGVFSPVLFFFLVYLANYLLLEWSIIHAGITPKTRALISIFSNLAWIRYYFVNVKYDKTGRSVLVATLVYTVAFFILEKHFDTFNLL
jgi:uncharacterized membrane protein